MAIDKTIFMKSIVPEVPDVIANEQIAVYVRDTGGGGGFPYDIDHNTIKIHDNIFGVNTVDMLIYNSKQPITSGGVYDALQEFTKYKEIQ